MSLRFELHVRTCFNYSHLLPAMLMIQNMIANELETDHDILCLLAPRMRIEIAELVPNDVKV